MIRLATIYDVPRIVELGSLSLKSGPYAELIKDSPEHTKNLTINVINGGGKILLWLENEMPMGLLAFIVIPHPFTGELMADEIIWFVLQEARKGGAGIKLLWAAEDLAKHMGVKHFQFTAPNKEVSALYKRFGYSEIETVFLKELHCHS